MPNEKYSGKTVLVVDDDDDIRSGLTKILKKIGFEVLEASNGLQAKALSTQSKINLIISDVRMPDMNGIDLLHYIKKTNPVPFILMTGFSDIVEAQEAFTLGADNFLPKPFSRDELFKSLNHVFSSNSDPEPKVSEAFCKVPIEEFTASSNLKVDVYLNLSDTNYIKVATRSSELSSDRLDTYKKKGLNFLYIKKEDFSKYVGLNVRVLKAASGTATLSREKKFHILKHTAEVLLQDTYVNGLDKKKFDTATGVVSLVLDAMGADKDLFLFLERINRESDFLYAHSLGVSLYSSLIAEEIGWSSPDVKLMLSMGGLLHDIGEKELDRTVLGKARKDMDRHEIQLYESHAIRGRDILSQIPSIPVELIFIALQHHENCLGSGYPNRLVRSQIHPFSRIVSLANHFCELVLKNPSQTIFEPLAALDRILRLNENEFDPAFLGILLKIFNHSAHSKFLPEIEKLQHNMKAS